MDLFATTGAELLAGHHVVLATIVAVRGSSPAPVLSRMVVRKDGSVAAGTVGGGCVENDIRTAARDLCGGTHARWLTIGLSEQHAEVGPICGGSLDVLLEPLFAEDARFYETLHDVMVTGEDQVVATRFGPGGERRWKRVIRKPAADRALETLPDGCPPEIANQVAAVVQKGVAFRFTVDEEDILLLEPVKGRPCLLVFGGGHVGRAIAQAVAPLGFSVTVVDDRESYAAPDRFPATTASMVCPFERVTDAIPIPPGAYIVVVTRGHQHDELVLEQILNRNARYIGMIGSRRKVALAFDHLRARGIPPDALAAVHAPIGIDIGAVSVEEIAVSVAAELVAVRRGALPPFAHCRNRLHEVAY